MIDIHENDHDSNEPILATDPCVECGDGFTPGEWAEVHSYGSRGDVHARCCRALDCVENDPWCE